MSKQKKRFKNTNFEPQEKEKMHLDMFSPESVAKINMICGIIKKSTDHGMKFDEVVEKLFNPKMRQFIFLQAYLSSYKYNKAHKEMIKQKVISEKGGFESIFLSGNIKSYMSDKEALLEIYKAYLEKEKEENEKG